MQNKIPVTVLKPTESHRHPTFDISREEYKCPVLDNHLKVGIKKFQDKIQIRFRREHVKELRKRKSRK
jgi:hypothetical protein